MKRIGVLLLGALCLGGCASSVGKGAGDTMRMTRVGMREAVVAPLKDFNLVRSKVPPALASAAKDAYHLPGGKSDCPTLIAEIRKLDLALGPDLDVPRNAGRPTMSNRASHAASDAALDAVRDLTTGWIPFRSTVRRLTGAANNEDEMEDAVHAGAIRRAYLKGLGLQQGCAHPAAPLPAPTRELLMAQEPAPAPEAVSAEAVTGQGDAAPADGAASDSATAGAPAPANGAVLAAPLPALVLPAAQPAPTAPPPVSPPPGG